MSGRRDPGNRAPLDLDVLFQVAQGIFKLLTGLRGSSELLISLLPSSSATMAMWWQGWNSGLVIVGTLTFTP